MGEKHNSMFWSQLKAMLIRNILIKKREKRKTIAEVLLPLYSLATLILMKVLIPNPNFPIMDQPRGEASLFEHFDYLKNHTVAIVPNTTETLDFLHHVDALWRQMHADQLAGFRPITWLGFATREDLLTHYWLAPASVPIAVIFETPPAGVRFHYEIRTNPSTFETPSTTALYSSPASCRQSGLSAWSSVFPIEAGDSCPVNQYYYSGFIALQTLLDWTRIRLDGGDFGAFLPTINIEMFPKLAYTANWMVAFRVIIPLYMVMALSQFITYLLILIVGEKENRIKEGMKIMGLKDTVFWLSWFIIYAIFVLFLSIVCCVLLFTLQVFEHSNFLLVFLLVVLYSFSIIMFGFMITPFFDKSRTAGILGNFAVNIMSLLYFIAVFVDEMPTGAYWVVSLISSSGFALAMDKALVMELKGEGVNFENLWSGEEGMAFGGSLVMMAFDVVLYGLLAFYLDSVIPSEHGTKRSPLFPLHPSYWCPAPPKPAEAHPNGSAPPPHDDVEPPPRDLKHRAAIVIANLYKSFQHCRKPDVKAIDGINLTIYEGQITAILGHNGAGKTTLFNILTGLTAPSAGTAHIFGLDVRHAAQMDRVRQMTGVCPQHDILFDNLTPKEHLEFFAAVKNIQPDLRDSEVERTLRDVDLSDKANSPVKHLSGGQKRKLSIGIAVIGDPKIIILDEPTAGVDPYSRRHMWSLLQNRRHGKVILLTTHFMDEADILADRKAVVSKGIIRCCGSSLFLKNKFGIGYHLTLVLDGTARDAALLRLVAAHVAKAEKARRHGREVSFILPHNAVDHFAPLFAAIEAEINNKSSKLGICSYGVSMTTLEEVFLHLERDVDDQVVNMGKKLVRNRALSRSLSLQSKSTSYQSLQGSVDHLDTIVESSGIGLEKIECRPSTCQTLFALLHLRCLRMFRDIQKLYFMVFLPLILAAFGLYFNSTQIIEPKFTSLRLNTSTYAHQMALAVFNGTPTNLNPFFSQLFQSGAENIDEYNGNFTLLLDIAPHFAAFNFNRFDTDHIDITLIYNDTAMHSLPIIINLLNNALHRLLTGQSVDFELNVLPFQQTAQPEEFNLGIFSASTFMGMVFVLVPISLAVDMVNDREIKAKNQLRVNGLTFQMYFITYFIVLAGLMILICIALIGIIFLFDIPPLRDWPALISLTFLLIIYCPASILFSTCVSYVFDKTDSAQSILPNIATLLGCIPFFLVIFLDMLRIGGRAAFVLHCLFSLFNTMYVPYAIIYYVQRVYIMCNVNFACTNLTLGDYVTDEIIVMLVGICLNIPIWFTLLRIIDVKKSGGRIGNWWEFVCGVKQTGVGFGVGGASEVEVEEGGCGEASNEDRDVKAEREKVRGLFGGGGGTVGGKQPVVMVQGLHKKFKKSVPKQCCECCYPNEDEEEVEMPPAVKSLSLAIDAGEVFGLLGHNGAGKTTTMRIITAEEAPTRGRVQIGGVNVKNSNTKGAFELLGYCPQFDALWKNITVREHLQYYAAIRGVPSGEITNLVNLYLSGLQIHEHADKQAGQCSGGTRRKLSFAMAMVGNPKIVLLDEPSTGMDPRSKRFLWNTILASFEGRRGAILTTHSMEEADALCSRVGIMVKGELRCLGSTQHLKNLYGAGYTLEMKVAAGLGGEEGGMERFVAGLFRDAVLQERFADRMVFSVPQQSVPSLANCFKQLEKAKSELNIEEYSFSQTTLEQVFLKFAQYDEINSGD